MKKSRLTFYFIATAFLVVTWSGAAQACACRETPPLTKEIYDHYNMILIGKILDYEKPYIANVETMLGVKGQIKENNKIIFSWSEMCGGILPKEKAVYLIYATLGKTRSGKIEIVAGGCGGVKELTESELDLVKLLQFKQEE